FTTGAFDLAPPLCPITGALMPNASAIASPIVVIRITVSPFAVSIRPASGGIMARRCRGDKYRLPPSHRRLSSRQITPIAQGAAHENPRRRHPRDGKAAPLCSVQAYGHRDARPRSAGRGRDPGAHPRGGPVPLRSLDD